MSMFKYKFLLFFILQSCFLSISSAFGQSIQATVRADSNAMMIGDQLRLRLIVDAPKGVAVSMPDLQTLLKPAAWELINISEPTVQAQEGNLNRHEVEVIVTAWEAGEKAIPAMTFNSNDGAATSQIINIRIDAPPVVDSTYVADIKTIIEVPISWLDYWLYILAAVLLILLPYPLYLAYKKYKAGTLFPRAAPSTPEAIALEKLLALEKTTYLAEQKYSLYHSEATFILREYLQARFKVRALYMTSIDTMYAIAAKPQVVDYSKDIMEVLETADMAKFAKASPLAAANTFALNTIRTFVTSVADHLRLEAERVAAQKKAKSSK